MSETIRVVVIDDHRMFTEAVELLLAGEEGIEVVGAAGSGRKGIELCARDRPDVALVDIDLPGWNGIETIRRIKIQAPQTRCVVMTALPLEKVYAAAAAVGAVAFVPKSRTAEALVAAVRAAAVAGTPDVMPPADPTHKNIVGVPRSRRRGLLTSRETEVLAALAQGASTTAIAKAMLISPLTVRSHVKSILGKLGAHSKLEAVTLALRGGFIELSTSERYGGRPGESRGRAQQGQLTRES